MSPEKESVLDRIKKLLALGGDNPSEAEANAAIAKAQELMLRHNIQMDDLQEREMKDYGSNDIPYDFMIETKWVHNVIRRYFFVQTIFLTRQKKWQMLGTKENVLLATYMYHHIKTKFKDAWKNYKEKNKLAGVEGKTDFMKGCYEGLVDKLEAEKVRLKQEEGLVWLGDKKLDLYFKEQHPDTSSKSSSEGRVRGDADAHGAGYSAGRSMQLSKGLTDGDQKNHTKALPAMPEKDKKRYRELTGRDPK